jgi:hypothetical protein
MFLGFGTQSIKHNSWLNPSSAARRVDFKDLCHVLRKVENDGGVTTLARK